ncbi:LacI family transcriptional regulator [Aureibacter tunicatorum]|nr:LacI family transcriptional regulator [Aureibacter tunicatorum]
MKDIADRLGVSVSTVSKAIKGSYDVSAKTREKVMKLVEELDFEPNKQAQSLLQNKSYTLGVVVPDLDNSFFGSIIRGIENIAYQNGYNLIICQSHEDSVRELSDLKSLINHQVDGLILALASSTKDLKYLESLKARNFPYVLIDRGNDDLGVSQVLVDDFTGGMNASKLLFETGCLNVAHLAGPEKLINATEREEGYKQVCEDFGFDPLVVHCEFNEEKSFEKTLQLLQKHPEVDGIFAASDRIAVGAMQAVKSLGKSIPEDVSVIGFSDLAYSKYLEPALTTISQPAGDMGEKAMKVLLETMKQSEDENVNLAEKFVYQTKLIIRNSTKEIIQ